MKKIQLATRAEARAILGRDFHGPEEVNLAFGCNLTEDGSWFVPYTVEILEKTKSKYILFTGCDEDKNKEKMTISWFHKKFPEGTKPGFTPQFGEPLNNYPFWKKRTCQRQKYYLLPKKIPLDHPSRNKGPVKFKLAKTQNHEKIEPAIVYVFGIFLHYLCTKEIMYPYDYVLTTNKVGEHFVRVGHFKYKDVYVGLAQPGWIYNMLGVAPSIKPLLME